MIRLRRFLIVKSPRKSSPSSSIAVTLSVMVRVFGLGLTLSGIIVAHMGGDTVENVFVAIVVLSLCCYAIAWSLVQEKP